MKTETHRHVVRRKTGRNQIRKTVHAESHPDIVDRIDAGSLIEWDQIKAILKRGDIAVPRRPATGYLNVASVRIHLPDRYCK